MTPVDDEGGQLTRTWVSGRRLPTYIERGTARDEVARKFSGT